MTPKDFLYNELKLIASKFLHVNIKYGYDLMIETHVIELTPESEYYNNQELYQFTQ